MQKKTLIVGQTGFLGRVIAHAITGPFDGMSRSNGRYIVDISRTVPVIEEEYTTVICAAGKAHSTPITLLQEQEFFQVNFEGVKNLVQGFENFGILPERFVFVSTVSVYGLDQGKGILEESIRNGKSSYALSKILAEDFLLEWAEQNGVILTILRLPLVVGPNPPGNLGKMIEGIRRGRYISLGGGQARKSMVLAEDVAAFIPKISGVGGIYNLTDGVHPMFRDIENVIKAQVGQHFIPSCPLFVAKLLGRLGNCLGSRFPVDSSLVNKMTSTLTFSDQKARDTRLWSPRPVVENFHI